MIAPKDKPHSYEPHCCIVGGGPAGVLLAFLLARQGVDVVLLEAQKDFNRDFRGDSIIPGVMEILEELGLASDLLQLRHAKIPTLTVQTDSGFIPLSDYSQLKTQFPYLTIMPQALLLEFIVNKAKQHPNFRVIMGANVSELIEENGVVIGVRYQMKDECHEIKAHLTVGADGRFSRIRKLGGFKVIKTPSLMDVLWFRFPRKENDLERINLSIRVGGGLYLGCWEANQTWQCYLNFAKGRYQKMRSDGIESLQQSIRALAPELADRVHLLTDWSQTSFLSVETSRITRWCRPGLLLIGDAAHVMSSVGGVGINCAIQDAVVTSNLLGQEIKRRPLKVGDLAKIQSKREWPTRIMQLLQVLVEKKLIARALEENKLFKLPLSFRLPFIRWLSSQITGFGIWPVHVKN